MLRAVLAGEKGPRRDLAALNAAAALDGRRASRPISPPASKLACAALDSGAAERALEALVRVSCAARDAEAEA